MQPMKSAPIRGILIALSMLLLLFTGWIGVKGEYRDELQEQVNSAIETIDGYGGLFGMFGGSDVSSGSIKAVKSFLKKFSDGVITPFEAARMAPQLSKLVDVVSSIGQLTGDDMDEISGLRFWLWLYTILFWATILFGAVAIIQSLMKKPSKFVYVYFVGLLLIFLVFILLKGELSDAIGGEDLIGLRFWPFIAVLCGLLSLFVHKLPFLQGAGAHPAGAGMGAGRPVNGYPGQRPAGPYAGTQAQQSRQAGSYTGGAQQTSGGYARPYAGAGQPVNGGYAQPVQAQQPRQTGSYAGGAQQTGGGYARPYAGAGQPVNGGYAQPVQPQQPRQTGPYMGAQQPRNTEGWLCPTCGSLQQITSAFCSKCGTPRPASTVKPQQEVEPEPMVEEVPEPMPVMEEVPEPIPEPEPVIEEIPEKMPEPEPVIEEVPEKPEPEPVVEEVPEPEPVVEEVPEPEIEEAPEQPIPPVSPAKRAVNATQQAPRAKFCMECGAPLVPGARFCMECGHPL